MNKISFDTNNGGWLSFEQDEHDSNVRVHVYGADCKKEYGNTISCGDFVMLWNLYRYVKDNNIQNDFINPDGVNHDHL